MTKWIYKDFVIELNIKSIYIYFLNVIINEFLPHTFIQNSVSSKAIYLIIIIEY